MTQREHSFKFRRFVLSGTEIRNYPIPLLKPFDEIIQVQPDFGDQHEPEAAGEHGQGHPPQLDAALSSDKDGVGEPPKSAGSKRYVIANR